MIPITDASDILSDICKLCKSHELVPKVTDLNKIILALKILNQYFVLSLGKRLNRESTLSSPPSTRFETSDFINDESKDAHMRDTLGLVRPDPRPIPQTNQPTVLLDPLDINLLSKNDKVKLEKVLREARKRFPITHNKCDLTSDFVWKYFKRFLPVMLVRPEEQQASIANYEKYCGTSIPYAELENQRSTLKKTQNRKRGHENEIMISSASLKKFNLSTKDAPKLIKHAQSCYITIDPPDVRGSM